MKTKTKTETSIRIQSLDQLQQLCDRPVICYIKLDHGPVIEIPCRRLDAKTQEIVLDLRRAAKPKYDERRKDYDLLDENYLRARDENQLIARAVMIYACCPMVAAKQPGLQDRKKIFEFVQGLFTENILQALELTIQGGGLELVEGANFTSAPGSES